MQSVHICLAALLRSGRCRGPGKPSEREGCFAPHNFESFPVPRPDLKNVPPKTGQTAFKYPVQVSDTTFATMVLVEERLISKSKSTDLDCLCQPLSVCERLQLDSR